MKTNETKEVKYSHWMVEVKDRPINMNSTICLSPYDTKTNTWQLGLMEITKMSEAIKRRNIVCNKEDAELIEFIEKNLK